MNLQPHEPLEDTISLDDHDFAYSPHSSQALSEEWYSRDKDCDMEYKSGIRFCTLYRKAVRSRREEAELGMAYWGAYQAAYATAGQIAQKAGLRDSELIADCAAGLVDFCARQYDETAVGRGGRPKTFADFLKNIAYAYLRKHRDFLAFAKKMTGTGYASQDLMTVATFGDEYARMKRESASEDDYRDVLDTLDPDAVESLYAAEWAGFATEDDDEVGQSINEIEDRLPATLREWIDYLLQQIQHSGMSPATLAMRVPAILEQLKSATGARVMDIIKRLVARVKAGCQVALNLLMALRPAIPAKHARTLTLIDGALQSIRKVPQVRLRYASPKGMLVAWQETPPDATTAVSVSNQEMPVYKGMGSNPAPTIQTQSVRLRYASPQGMVISWREIWSPLPQCVSAVDLTVPVNTIETAARVHPSSPDSDVDAFDGLCIFDEDLAFLIEPSDLLHGRIPPAKPRYVTVDAPPDEPSGAPPFLDENSPPGDVGPPETQILVLLRRARARKGRPRKNRMASVAPIPPGIRLPATWQAAMAL
ncbi:hypothetical protein AB4090_02235 [Acidithiobacillus sp. IBUN Pt1247-S3]|uniref:hypothetical protein n=1 Tax=Acidithiobacillus sp. IBUN Pt1247-S3 TaxID=3166642 RepID=UPI0034E45515